VGPRATETRGRVRTDQEWKPYGEVAGCDQDIRKKYADADIFTGCHGGFAHNGPECRGGLVVQAPRGGNCGAAECDRSPAAAELEWGFQCRLSAVRIGR